MFNLVINPNNLKHSIWLLIKFRKKGLAIIDKTSSPTEQVPIITVATHLRQRQNMERSITV
jgi:hypothetical protein